MHRRAANRVSRWGRLNIVPMSGVVAKLNDREIKAVSDYIAGLH